MVKVSILILCLFSFSVHAGGKACGEHTKEKALAGFHWENFGDIDIDTPYGDMLGKLCLGLIRASNGHFSYYYIGIITFRAQGEQNFYKSWSFTNLQKKRAVVIDNHATAKIKKGNLVSVKISEAKNVSGSMRYTLYLRFVRKLNRMSADDKRVMRIYFDLNPLIGRVQAYAGPKYKDAVNKLTLDVNWWGTVKSIILKSFQKTVKTVKTDKLTKISAI